MNTPLRIIISTGLFITAFTSLNLSLFQGILLNDQLNAYINRSFQTTCLILRTPYIYSVGSDLNCDLVRNLIGGLLISSAICVLALGSKKIFLLSALSNYSVI